VIVISEFKSFPGILIKCRIIGGFQAEQSEEPGKDKMIRNDRFLAVPNCTGMYENLKSVKDLPDKSLKELEDFFVNYNQIEKKRFKVIKTYTAKEAAAVIHSSA